MTNDAYWITARRVCTVKEFEVLELRDKHGLGTRVIAFSLCISRGAVRDRLENADRKIKDAMKEAA